jgi:hypothetical protein
MLSLDELNRQIDRDLRNMKVLSILLIVAVAVLAWLAFDTAGMFMQRRCADILAQNQALSPGWTFLCGAPR